MKNLINFRFVILMSCNSKSPKSVGQNLESKIDSNLESTYYSSNVNFYTILIKNDSLNGEYYFGRGYYYLQLMDYEKAERDYLVSIKLNFNKVSSYYNLGLIHSSVNDSIALIYFKKALDLYPNNDCLPKKKDVEKEYNACLKRIKK